jgi:hypothetical protein
VLQVRGSDYTATNGTSVVLSVAALVSDVLAVVAYGAFNVSDTYTQAQADAKFFQTANAFLAGKNKIMNADFSVNQKNSTSTTTSNTFLLDRWRTIYAGGTTTYSVETFTPGTAPVAGYEGKNYWRMVTTGQSAVTDSVRLQQNIESVRTFAGQSTTISFWAKAASGTPQVAIFIVQAFGGGGSAGVDTLGGTVTLSTSWVRYTLNVAVPSISGKTIGTDNSDNLSLRFFVSAGSSVNGNQSIGVQNNTFDFWGVQWEAGSVATAFQTMTGTIQGELAACQRYYYRSSGASIYAAHGTGSGETSTTSYIVVNNPVPLRTNPSSVDFSTLALYDQVNVTAVTNVTIGNSNNRTTTVQATVASGLTVYRPYILLNNNNTAGYLGFSAEL